jgi:putative intracellular protease/amidase
MTHLLVVEHDPDAPAGLLAGWAAAGGLAVATVRLHAGDPLPPADACDAAVVLGSEQTAYDDAVPWLAAELAFVRRLLAGEVPVLGICFGAQVLARVLGARLYRLAEPEIGWVRGHQQAPGPGGGAVAVLAHRRLRPAGRAPPSWRSTRSACRGSRLARTPRSSSTRRRPGRSSRPGSRTADPPPGREVTDPLFTGADGAWQQASANAGTFFSAWLEGQPDQAGRRAPLPAARPARW